MTVQLQCINLLCCNFSKIFPIMLALCLMLLVTYYAQNYAGIIGWSLLIKHFLSTLGVIILLFSYKMVAKNV